MEQYVENKPNVWNAVVGMSKLMSGYGLTSGEQEAMSHALSDRRVRQEWEDLMETVGRKED